MVNCDLAREAATVAFKSECVVMAMSYSALKASQWGSFKSECLAYARAVDLLPLIERKYGKQRGNLAAFARSVGITTGQITNVIKGRRTISSADAVAWESLPRPIQATPAPLFPHYREARPWALKRGSAAEITDWYRNTIGKRLKLADSGMDGIYHLKRWAITRMLRSGLTPATVAAFTGHRDLSQVMTYNVSNQDAQGAALASLDLVPGSVPKFLDPKS